MALKELPEASKELHTLVDLLVDFFSGPDQDLKIGAVLLSLYSSGIPQGMYSMGHDLHVLVKQLQLYIAQLGADISSAESALGSFSSPLIPPLGGGIS